MAFSLIDWTQVLSRVYDEAGNRLRVDTGASLTIDGEVEVSIDAASGDNIKISDGVDTLSVNSDGSINVDIRDSNGSAIILGQQLMASSLPVVIASDQTPVPISATSLPLPTGAATEATLAKLPLAQSSTTSGEYGILTQGAVSTSAPTYIDGQTNPLSLTTSGSLRVEIPGSISGTVTVSNLPATVDTNYGIVGSSTIRTASQIGNATGAAEFGSGVTTAQVLRTVIVTDQSPIPSTQSGVWSVGRTWSLLSGTDSVDAVQSGTWNINDISGMISLPTGASTSALQTTGNTSLASIDGHLDVNLSTRASESTLSILNGKVANDYGVSSGAVRTAAQIGNTTGAAAFGAGTTSAQTLRVVIPTDQTSIPATQSGTWDITNITGTISLPTGAATSANQLTEISHLSSIDTDIDVALSTRASESTLSSLNSKITNDYGVSSGAIRSASQIGNTTGAALFGAGTTTGQVLRVVLPTDQTAIPVSQSGSWSTGRTWTLASGIDSVSSVQSGTWTVQQGTPPWSVVGAAANGVAKSGNPVQTGFVFNTTQPTVTSGQVVESQATARGGLIVATGVDAFDINNITGTVSLPTGAATAANQTTQITSLQLIDDIVHAPNAALSKVAAIGGQMDDTSTVIATEDNVSAVRITSQRAIHVNLRDSTGTEKLGQQTSANSIPVVLPSDQTISITNSPLPPSGSGFSFGDVATAASTQVKVERTTYTEQTSDAQRSVNSSNANDTSAGTGARTITITYYNSTGAGPFTETITLNGTSSVNTTNTDICFIEKMVVASVGSGGANAGTITLKAATGGGGATIGTITTGNNETFWAHHYVPTGKTCYISGFSVNNDQASINNGALFIIKKISVGVANAVEIQISDFMSITGQTATIFRNYQSPIQVVGPARITAYVTPYSNTAAVQRASFDFIDN